MNCYNSNKLGKSDYLGILITHQEYRKINVVKQIIAISMSWLHEQLGIERRFFVIDNKAIYVLKLYQIISFKNVVNKGKNGLIMHLSKRIEK